MTTPLTRRISWLQELAKQSTFIDDVGLLRACVNCLSPEEAASVLVGEAASSSSFRNAVLRKVTDDASKALLHVHHDLVNTLIQELPAADARGRQGIGYCLSSLLPNLSDDQQEDVQSALLASSFIGLRRRGYKAIGRAENPRVHLLLKAWRDFKDPECAWLLVKILPLPDLVTLKCELLPHLTGGWMVSRLYLRIAAIEDASLDELASIDGISYCYVLAKLGRTLSSEHAKSFLEKYEFDERFGLLVWSLGQMGCWEVLKWLSGQMPAIQERKLAAVAEQYGV